MIELMVVIVILGILSALLYPKVPVLLNRAKEGKTKGNLATLKSTIRIYYSDNDSFSPIDNLETLIPKYIKQIPECSLPPHHAASTAVTNDTTIGDTDEGFWQYNNDESDTNWGDIWIECSHADSSGAMWSSF